MSHPQTPETREKIRHGLRRYYERRRAVTAVAPLDLARFGKGIVTPRLRSYLRAAEAECADVLEALGGADNVSAQRRVIVEDLARVGVVLRGTLAAYLRTEDPELASKVGTLAAARRGLLVALGLERVSKELDLASYLEQRAAENRSGEANGGEPDTLPAGAAPNAPRGNGGGALDASPGHPAVVPDNASPTERPSGAHGEESHEEHSDSTNS